MKASKLEERLRTSDFKLNSLLAITHEINKNSSVAALMEKYRNILEGQLGIARIVLFALVDDEWQLPLHYGIKLSAEHVQPPVEFESYTATTRLEGAHAQKYAGLEYVLPVHHQGRAVAYLLIGDIDDDTVLVSPLIKHMRIIQTLTNFITVAIQNKALMKKALEQERTRTELQLAAEMQSLITGSGCKDYKAFRAATYYKPHQQVGGDFCDFIALTDDEAFFCVADVSGKGVSAAFLMANVHAYLQALLKYTEWSLESLIVELNEKVVNTVQGSRFVTLFVGHYDRRSRKLQYVNAGHAPPVLLNGDTLHLLEEGTVGVGMLDHLPFMSTGSHTLLPGALLVAFTDGVVELENEADEELGTEKLGAVLQAMKQTASHPDDLIAHIVNAMDSHRGSRPYFDDTALLCCQFD